MAKHILVIDDHSSVRRLLTELFGRSGHSVLVAATGGRGLELFAAENPDLILLDVRLPDLSGLEVCRRIRSLPGGRNVPILGITGADKTDDDYALCLRAGMDDCLWKPIDVNYLSAKVAFLLARAKPHPVPATAGILERDVHSVLVIDDEEATAEYIRSLLSGRPYRVISAASGIQGLRLAAVELPDLVILDLHMQGMDGAEVCRRLRLADRERPWPLPILFLTGERREQMEILCLECGADDYLAKDAGSARLMARIRTLIRRQAIFHDRGGSLALGSVALDAAAGRVTVAGSCVFRLRRTESALLSLLMTAAGRPADKAVLAKKLFHAWPDPTAANLLQKHVSNLRKRLGPFRDLVESISGNGYRFNLEYAQGLNRTPREKALNSS